ncbi:aldo/keto reductase [PVC group bacterium]|nr:aldo/keto reductase [PVC group bacterium]
MLGTGCTIVSNQLAYNLLFRAIEFEIKPICVREDLSVLCYSPMMQGLLTGKFATADDVPEDRSRTRHYSGDRPHAMHGGPGAEEEVFTAVAEIRQIADGLGQPMANVSLAWLLAQEGITSVIAGGRNAKQAQLNVAAADLTLPPDALEALSNATEPLKQKLGSNADMWRQDEEAPRIR